MNKAKEGLEKITLKRLTEQTVRELRAGRGPKARIGRELSVAVRIMAEEYRKDPYGFTAWLGKRLGNEARTAEEESEAVKAISDVLDSLGVLHWHVRHGSEGPAGVPDVVGIYQGRLLAIKVKRPGQNVTAAWKTFLADVRERGGVAFTAERPDDVLQNLNVGL